MQTKRVVKENKFIAHFHKITGIMLKNTETVVKRGE